MEVVTIEEQIKAIDAHGVDMAVYQGMVIHPFGAATYVEGETATSPALALGKLLSITSKMLTSRIRKDFTKKAVYSVTAAPFSPVRQNHDNVRATETGVGPVQSNHAVRNQLHIGGPVHPGPPIHRGATSFAVHDHQHTGNASLQTDATQPGPNMSEARRRKRARDANRFNQIIRRSPSPPTNKPQGTFMEPLLNALNISHDSDRQEAPHVRQEPRWSRPAREWDHEPRSKWKQSDLLEYDLEQQDFKRARPAPADQTEVEQNGPPAETRLMRLQARTIAREIAQRENPGPHKLTKKQKKALNAANTATPTQPKPTKSQKRAMRAATVPNIVPVNNVSNNEIESEM